MKTDYEMTESLIKRRDEYLAGKRKRAALKLIPKTVIPLFCMIVVIAGVMAFNGVFAPPKVDISLVPGNTNLSALENLGSQSPSVTTADFDDKVNDIESAVASMEASLANESSDSAKWEDPAEWVYAADILNAIKEGMEDIISDKDSWHFEPLETRNPECFVQSGLIYYLVDPAYESYSDLGFDVKTARISREALPAAVLYEIVEKDGKDTMSKYIFGSLYRIVGMEGYVTLLYEGRFWLYRAEKRATFTVNDRNYYTHIALSGSERYTPSNMMADFSDDYTVYYAFDDVTGQICSGDGNDEAVYVVISAGGEKRDAWVCLSYPAAPEEYRLRASF